MTLTQAAPAATRARWLYGPPRYSEYEVRLFLLSEGGVREVNTRLDFATGALSDQRRLAFRYESLTSAEVGEVGVQFESGQREVVSLNRRESQARQQLATHKLTLARALQLTLNNGQRTFVLVENFDQGFVDRLRENIASLQRTMRCW